MRLRTIGTAYREIVENDPDTAISQWFIRKLVTEGAIPSEKSGNKYIIDLDKLEEYLDENTGKYVAERRGR